MDYGEIYGDSERCYHHFKFYYDMSLLKEGTNLSIKRLKDMLVFFEKTEEYKNCIIISKLIKNGTN
jgi:hypothetical protein